MQTDIINKRQHVLVHPCVINGEQTLVYERGLDSRDPYSYKQIKEYARRHGYVLREDRRANFLDGINRVKDKNRATILAIMVLGASLFSRFSLAGALDEFNQDYVEEPVTQNLNEVSYVDLENLEINSDNLMPKLIEWINNHSSFKHSVDDYPVVRRVDTEKIAEIAFGKSVPMALDFETLKISGLYNFNEKVIYLHDSVDLETEKGRAVLLHELVHFLQYHYEIDESVECKNELESIAYLLEAKYLVEHNETSHVDNGAINNISQCR